MKEFENKIYRRLLAPVLACLVLALAGCSQDATEAEAPSSPTGGTYLTIVTRGIVTGTEDQGNYEDYVGSLRVIAFKNGEVALNKKLTDLPNEEGTQPDTKVDLTEEGERLQIGTGGGAYTFYFIANEEGHTTDNTDLSEALSADGITAETLESMQVAFTQDEIKAPSTSISKYMLMSTKMTVYIKEGVDQSIEIELVRALAKAQLVLRKAEDNNETYNPTVKIASTEQIPNSYYLMSGHEASTSCLSLTGDVSLNGNGTVFDTNAASDLDFYVSETIYLPERLATGLDDALKYTITIDNKDYTAPVANGEDPDEIDYDITRNYAYTTIGTYNPLTEVMSDFNLLVVPWDEKVIDVPPFE